MPLFSYSGITINSNFFLLFPCFCWFILLHFLAKLRPWANPRETSFCGPIIFRNLLPLRLGGDDVSAASVLISSNCDEFVFALAQFALIRFWLVNAWLQERERSFASCWGKISRERFVLVFRFIFAVEDFWKKMSWKRFKW